MYDKHRHIVFLIFTASEVITLWQYRSVYYYYYYYYCVVYYFVDCIFYEILNLWWLMNFTIVVLFNQSLKLSVILLL